MASMIPRLHDLAGVELIDLVYGDVTGAMGSYLIRGEHGRFMLVETGPLAVLPQVEAALKQASLDPHDLTDVLVTHIHLDHAGSTGTLARRYGARIHVHAQGAPHLLDPERLLSSSRRAYGAEAFDRLMGGLESVPPDNLVSFEANDEFALHDHDFRVLATPGHSGSHTSFLMDGHDLFAGDAAGIRLPGPAYVRPATAPPEIDLEAWDVSLDLLRQAGAQRLLLTHFGAYDDVETHLQQVAKQNRLWAEEVRVGLDRGETAEQLEQRIAALAERQMEEAGIPEPVRRAYRLSSDARMNAAGLARYWSKRS